MDVRTYVCMCVTDIHTYIRSAQMHNGHDIHTYLDGWVGTDLLDGGLVGIPDSYQNVFRGLIRPELIADGDIDLRMMMMMMTMMMTMTMMMMMMMDRMKERRGSRRNHTSEVRGQCTYIPIYVHTYIHNT